VVSGAAAFVLLILARLPAQGYFLEGFLCVGLGLTVAAVLRSTLSERDPYAGLSGIRVTDSGVDLEVTGGLSQATWEEIDPTRVASRSGMIWIPIVRADRYSAGWLLPIPAFEELRKDPRFPSARLPPDFRGPAPPPWSNS
jgi:hypothetical protein